MRIGEIVGLESRDKVTQSDLEIQVDDTPVEQAQEPVELEEVVVYAD